MRLTNHKAQAAQLPVDKLRPFEGHPFRVKDDSEVEDNEYEVISGHRRLHACKKAGIEMVPALIYSLDRDAATIAMVDSNLHREKILPSEKAFAYKLKMEAMSHQGQRTDLTLLQVATKLDTAAEIGKTVGDSRDKVFRYIRLTELIPEILTMVDDGKIAFTPAVEQSYLSKQGHQDTKSKL